MILHGPLPEYWLDKNCTDIFEFFFILKLSVSGLRIGKAKSGTVTSENRDLIYSHHLQNHLKGIAFHANLGFREDKVGRNSGRNGFRGGKQFKGYLSRTNEQDIQLVDELS